MEIPDVLTHLLVGVSIALLVQKDGPQSRQMLIVLGAALIDIERPISWLLANSSLYWIELGYAFHSILGAVILSFFGASCFELESSIFLDRFKLILLGCVSHLLLDMVMYPWAELGLQLLYPLKIQFSFNLLWSDVWVYPAFGGIAFGIALLIRYMMDRNPE
ncbi:MAG: metal-dependent hydrolase [Candidatus Thorarchaeota archaeon]